jgi:hypothetical protein
MIPLSRRLDSSATPVDEDLCLEIAEAIRLTAAPPESYRAAVLVGSRGTAMVQALVRVAPTIERVLLLEPDPTMLQRLQGWDPPCSCFVGEVPDVVGEYSTSTYLEACQFLLAQGVAPRRTLFHVDQRSLERRPQTYGPVAAAVTDLEWQHSSTFFRAVNVNALPSRIFLRWADFLADNGAPFHALKFFYRLKDRVEAQALARRVMRCWMDLQCPEPMRPWIPFFTSNDRQRRHLEAEIEQAIEERSQAGAKRRQMNLDAIAARTPRLAEILGGARSGSGLLLATIRDLPWRILADPPSIARGDYPLFFQIYGSQIHELNPPHDPRPLHSALAGTKAANPHVLFGNVSQPERLLELLETPYDSPIPNAEQAVFILEHDRPLFSEVFDRLLATADLSAALQKKRLFLFVGEDGGREMTNLFEENPILPIPHLRFALDPKIEEALAAIPVARARRGTLAIQHCGDLCPPGFSGELLRVLEGRQQRPLRVLLLTSVFTTVLQYVTRDMAAAFEELGHEALIVSEKDGTERMTAGRIAEQVVAFRPDLFFTIDHLRPEYLALPADVPFVCWIQDEMPQLSDPGLVARVGPRDLTYVVVRSWVPQYRAVGYPHLGHLPFAANTEIYAPADDVADPVDEVAYVTHLCPPSEPRDAPGLFDWIRPRLENEERPLPTVASSAPLVAAASAALDLRIPPPSMPGVLRAVHLLSRHIDRVRIAGWLVDAGIPLAAYGSGWCEHPRFRSWARGVVRSGAPLRRVYQRAKVVLHINNDLNCHSRVFEGIASGGFVLVRASESDEQPGELGDRLAIGSEVIRFSSRDQLVQTVQRAFSDEGWRREVIDAGRRRVLAEHRYRNRAQIVLEDIRSAMARRHGTARVDERPGDGNDAGRRVGSADLAL